MKKNDTSKLFAEFVQVTSDQLFPVFLAQSKYIPYFCTQKPKNEGKS